MTIENLYDIFLQHPVVSTDSRNCPPDCLFFALKGEKFDGNDYVQQSLLTAAFAIVDRAALPDNEKIIKVDNVLETLQALARFHRQQMKAKVIAITGTNGKTTTKELIAAALSSEHETLYTQGNLNNHIGVPLTLLGLRQEHEFAVVETGANHPREIAALCEIALPDFGIITNVGKAHLEGFGSFEGVIKTKTELYDYLRENDKIAFVNADNEILKPYYSDLNTIKYGTSDGLFAEGQILHSSPFLIFEWKKKNSIKPFRISTNLVGAYNFENAMAAVCIASYFGISAENICRAISNYTPTNNRSQSLQTDRNRLIIDAYNANPTSMRAALENFFALPVAPKMLILGEMRELGDYTREEHRAMTAFIRKNGIKRVILCGENFAVLDRLPPEWRVFASTDALIAYLSNAKIEGYAILIKGSRGNRLERIVELL
jgi:UDP-N-acetylmuramoyl-tripeptide--D-alanyl-D-alanine ligase